MFGSKPFGKLPFGGSPSAADGVAVFLGKLEFTATSEYRLYIATREFVTGSDDIPAGQSFQGTFLQPLQFRRSIMDSDGFGGILQASGEMVISNADGEYDFLPKFYALDGRDQEVRLGYEGLPYRDWLKVFVGTATDAHVDEEILRIGLSDYAYKLDVPLQTKNYAGTGGVEGGEDIKGKPKPRLFGYVDNLTPVLLSAQYQLYQVNDGPIEAVTAVYTNGVALGYDGDFPTSAALIAAAITDGRYATCKAEGLFRIDFLLDGHVVTCDVQGDKTDGTFASTIADIIRRIVSTSTVIKEPAGLYLPSFAKFASQQPAPIGYYADHSETRQVRDVIADIVGYANYVGFRRNGKLEIVRFEKPQSPPAMRFDKTDIVDLKRERLPGNLNPPPWRWRVAYARNWTVQTSDVAGSVSDARRSYLSEEVRYAVIESAAVKSNHPFAGERDVNSWFRNASDAAAEATRLKALFSDAAALYRLTLDVRPMGLEVGEVISVTYPRFDLTDGKLLRVVEIAENAANQTTEIVGFG